jgi:hypothetical protein
VWPNFAWFEKVYIALKGRMIVIVNRENGICKEFIVTPCPPRA